MYVWRLCIYVYIIFLLFSITCVFREFSMLVEGHLVEWLILAKCVTLLKYCVNKINKKIKISYSLTYLKTEFDFPVCSVMGVGGVNGVCVCEGWGGVGGGGVVYSLLRGQKNTLGGCSVWFCKEENFDDFLFAFLYRMSFLKSLL